MITTIALLAGAIVLSASLWANAARKRQEGNVDDNYQPTVTIITPMYNEGESIRRTIQTILAQDYPTFDVIVVDDCSTDNSYQIAQDEAGDDHRIRIVRNDVNQGKRKSINHAVRLSRSEIIVSIDSDVEVAPDAVRQLVRRFVRPNIAAVGGRVDITNKRQNWLTKMQAVKYYYGYHSLKNMERAFRTVMCLSGCLTAYRRSVLVELEPILENRNVLGVAIKYGEDRYLTRQIIKAGYETTMTCDAICKTAAPHQLLPYFSQQLRWRRSNFIDYFGSFSHVWRIHPVVAICYYSVFVLFVTYPILIAQAMLDGSFWTFMSLHVVGVLAFGIFHRLRTWKTEPAKFWDFIPMAFSLPVTYGLLPILAVCTLDSGKWETRDHQESESEEKFPNPSLPDMPNQELAVSSSRPAA